jgi:hypothetical protein
MTEDIGNLKKDILDYLEVKLDLIKLNIAESLSHFISKSVNIAITGFLLFFIFLFISFAAGFFIGSRLNSNELGFLCVAGFYSLLLVLFILLRKKIIERPVIKAIIKLFFSKNQNDGRK